MMALAALVAAQAVPAQASRDRLSGYVTVTSDYRNRGLSQSRAEPSLQIGGDYQHPTGFFAGLWAATIEYASDVPGNSRRSELLYYAGYSRQVEDWSFAGTLGRYAYPDSGFDYDYNELTGSVDYRGRVVYTASYTDDLYGREVSALNQELAVRQPIPWKAELSATLGRFAADDFGVRYTHWNVGVSKTLRRFGLDLRYYDNDYDFDGPLGMAEGDWVLSVSYGFTSR
jgi:uncharacterized protein (TIGR02001 family)